MAKDEFINKKIDEYQSSIKESIINSNIKELHRILRFFAKEVERETRHKAAEMAQKLSSEIHNL